MEYGQFARVYNRYLAPEECKRNIQRLRRHLFPQIPSNAFVLDLCCGTGQVASELKKRGYNVSGLDSSEAMLSFAWQNAPGVKFVQGDACAFEGRSTFNAVISLSDSLNHILNEERLADVFACVFEALKKGGIFVFDLNKQEKYTTELHPSVSYVEDDQVCIIRAVFDENSQMATFVPTVFYRENGWQRFDTTIRQKAHEMEDVLTLLKNAGFSDVAAHDLEDDTEEEVRDKRILFVCRK